MDRNDISRVLTEIAGQLASLASIISKESGDFMTATNPDGINLIGRIPVAGGISLPIYGTPEKPLVVAQEVAKIIGHSNVRAMVERLDKSLYKKAFVNLYGSQKIRYLLGYDGLVSLLMSSRKAMAKTLMEAVVTKFKPYAKSLEDNKVKLEKDEKGK